MYIDAQYNRRVRIVGTPDAIEGRMLSVSDGETGKPITNITRVELVLDAGETNVARVSYHEYDVDGHMVTDDTNKPVVSTLILKGIEVDVNAYEQRKSLADVVFEALGEASMCWSERPTGVFDSVRAVAIGNEVMRAITAI